MSAGTLNIKIEKGATFSLPITITASGVDFTTYSARSKIAATLGGSILVAFTVSGEVKAVGSYALTLSLTPAQTVLLTGTPTAGTRTLALGWWDLEVYTAGDAIVNRYLEGTVTLSLEATT